MVINQKILEFFTESNIRHQDGICYLLALHFGYDPTYIPEILKLKMNTLRIYELEVSTNTIRWNIPLFEGQEVAFGWVSTEYEPLFKDANSKKGGKVKEATARMKKFFADNPEIRKEDVLGAVKMYLFNTDPNYIRFPHFFISKGVGVDKTQDLFDWVEKYKLSKGEGKGRVSTSNTMQ